MIFRNLHGIVLLRVCQIISVKKPADFLKASRNLTLSNCQLSILALAGEFTFLQLADYIVAKTANGFQILLEPQYILGQWDLTSYLYSFALIPFWLVWPGQRLSVGYILLCMLLCPNSPRIRLAKQKWTTSNSSIIDLWKILSPRQTFQNLQGTCPSMNLQVQQNMNNQTTTPIQNGVTKSPTYGFLR